MSYVSIIIPTLKHLPSLKKCLEGIIKHTNLKNIEVVVVANGCENDGTSEYVRSLGEHFLLLGFPKPLGYTIATNAGIKYALPHSDFVVLLNNDAYPTGDSWLETLIKPFDDPLVGITGPTKLYNNITKRQFLIGYCVCIKKEVLEKIGILDEIFNPGYGEDVDLCMKVEKAGYKLAQVPYEGAAKVVDGVWVGPYPMTHEAETTVHDPTCMSNWNEVKERNIKILTNRYGQPKVIAAIPTKGRYHTTLPMTLSSLLNQTRKPDYILIGDDNNKEEWEDITKDPVYIPLFQLATRMGIGVWIAYAPKKGLVWNDEMCQKYAIENGYQWILRLDDDVILEPHVLETLLSYVAPEVGGVCCPVLVPGETPATGPFCVPVDKVGVLPNIQWSEGEIEQEIEHCHCSYLYRPGIAHFNLDLSPQSQTEETQLSHEIFRKGYKIIYTPKCKIWHLKSNTGGCRNYDQQSMYAHDRAVFDNKLTEWKGLPIPFEVCLQNGLGDHIAFSNLIPELLEKHEKIRIGCCYHDVFNKWKNDPRVDIVPIHLSPVNPDNYNIYQKMMDWEWTGTLLEAFRMMYLSNLHPDYLQKYDPLDHLKEQDPLTYSEVFTDNCYEINEEKMRDRVVVDLGGNKGFFSISALEYGAREIICVEPNPRIYKEQLLPNVRRFPQIKTINKAIYNKDNIKLKLSEGDTGSSLKDPSYDGYEVETISLQTLIQDYPDTDMFLKMDCEGAEYEVIYETPTEILRKFKYINGEIHTFQNIKEEYRGKESLAPLVNKMEEHGFKLVRFIPIMWWDWGPNGEKINEREAGFYNVGWERK